MNVILHADGRFPYPAAAAYVPGDIMVRPDGSLAVLDGLEGVASGQLFSPTPLKDKIVEVDSASGSTFSVGASVYWDASAKLATATSSGNTLMGKAIRAKTSGQLVVIVNVTG